MLFLSHSIQPTTTINTLLHGGGQSRFSWSAEQTGNMYGYTYYSKSMDQPDKVNFANPDRGQLNRENNISLSAFAPENLVSRDGCGSPVPRQPAHLHNTQAEYGSYLRTGFLPSSAAASIYLFKADILRHRASPECIGSRLRIWSREMGSAVPSRVSLLMSTLRLNMVLTYGIPPEFRGGVHLFIQDRHTTSGQSRVYRVT